MRITVLTADAAQADTTGKVSGLGMGWSVVSSPLPGHAVVVLFHVDWHESNEKYPFAIDLLDEDGKPVDLEGNPVVHLEGEFEQGRPPGLVKGTPLVQPFVVNLPPGMPLVGGKRYEYRVTVGDVEGSAAFAVVP